MRPSLVSSLACFAALALTPAAIPFAGQKHRISPQLFQKFKRFTDFVSASAYQPCATPPHGAVAVSYINSSEYDTQASIFRSDARKQLILAIPGSDSREDYRIDGEAKLVPYISPGVSCDACYVHHGFLDAWNSIADQVQSELKTALATYSDYKVFVAGHSLGGALAQLAYSSLKGKNFPVMAAYTMGQPRVGDPAFADYIDSLSGASHRHAGDFHRITHANDIVPQMPSEKGGYRHSGTEYWESAINHTSAKSTFRCLGQDPSDCNKSVANAKLADKDDSHMYYSDIYISAPKSCGY